MGPSALGNIRGKSIYGSDFLAVQTCIQGEKTGEAHNLSQYLPSAMSVLEKRAGGERAHNLSQNLHRLRPLGDVGSRSMRLTRKERVVEQRCV